MEEIEDKKRAPQTSLLCRSKVKAFALEISRTKRAGKFTRVSKDFLDRMEARFKADIHSEIHRHPSVGKTLM